MAKDTLSQARSLIEKRLADLRKETQELEAALRRLGGRAAPARRSRSRGGGRGRSTKRGARSGHRAEQFKSALAKKPGAAVSEIAKQIGISSQQGHGIAKRLRERGEIKKQGKGYSLKS